MFDLLARDAVRQASDLAAAEGWFSARVEISVDGSTDPETVTLTVDTGDATRVTKVRVVVEGAAVADVPAGTDAIAQAQREWLLPEGDVFRQSAWRAAKRRAVATVTASPYAAAKIADSLALINPEAATAELSVIVDSGPPFRFGELAIRGLQRYDPAMVRNFSPIRAGDPYSRRRAR